MAERTSDTVVVVPRLTTPSTSMRLSVAAALIGAVGVVGWGLATRTGTDRVMAGLVGVGVVVFVVIVVWRRTWLDTAAGTVSASIAGMRTKHVAWADASTIDLQRNGAGLLNLRVVGGRTLRIPVLAIDMGGDRGLDPDVLRLLADQIATWSPARSGLADALRAQADAVEAGGSLRESPLARAL